MKVCRALALPDETQRRRVVDATLPQFMRIGFRLIMSGRLIARVGLALGRAARSQRAVRLVFSSIGDGQALTGERNDRRTFLDVGPNSYRPYV